MFESIALGVFVFVSIAVAGWRALDTLERAKREREAARIGKVRRAASRYTGPLYNSHGREIRA